MILAGSGSFDPLQIGARTLLLPRFSDANDRVWSLANEDPLGTETELLAWYAFVLRQRPGCFVDVGTNFGQTLVRILSIDLERRYIGFEPNVQCCSYLEALIFSNGLRNHSVFPDALSDSSGLRTLHFRDLPQPAQLLGTATMVEGFRPDDFYTGSRTIFTVVGDDVIRQMNIDSIGAIKIDVEGAEDEVFRGLYQTIRRFRPPIFHEVLPDFVVATRQPLGHREIEVRNDRLSSLNRTLAELDYRSFMIDGDGALHALEKLAPPLTTDLTMTNHISVPRETADDYAGFRPILSP